MAAVLRLGLCAIREAAMTAIILRYLLVPMYQCINVAAFRHSAMLAWMIKKVLFLH